MGLIILGKNIIYWTHSVVIADHLAHTKNKIWRTFWSLLLVVTVAGFFIHSSLLVRDYFSYGKTTTIRVRFFYATTYLTVCNLNPFKKSALGQSTELTSLVNAYETTLKMKAASPPETMPEARRRKRQSCTQSLSQSPPSCATGQAASDVYDLTSCSSYSNLTLNVNYGTIAVPFVNLASSDFSSNQNAILEILFCCVYDEFYNTNSACPFSTVMDFINYGASCAQAYIGSNYPVAVGTTDPLAILADGYMNACGLEGAGCTISYHMKPSDPNNGTYYYFDCPANGTTILHIQDCSSADNHIDFNFTNKHINLDFNFSNKYINFDFNFNFSNKYINLDFNFNFSNKYINLDFNPFNKYF
ncbi:hypothetical protein FO519_009514 [Halicephalobus sp. NKZ332]|nr:hypothetical protein FO519_009514 [Halicephalobus sp. NKZ332]